MISFKLIDPIVKVSHLRKTIPLKDRHLCILEDICFEITLGKTVAIVGTSGAGKTTLLGLLAGLDKPTSGEISLGGNSVDKLSENCLAEIRGQHLGFVFQDFQLLSHLTALENVMLPLELLNSVGSNLAARRLLEQVGLQDRLDHYPRQLSGGEQQRVAIARAFANDPDILFADEPTGNLDQATGEQIIKLLFDMNRTKKTTLIIVTHDDRIANNCQLKFNLEKGQICEHTK